MKSRVTLAVFVLFLSGFLLAQPANSNSATGLYSRLLANGQDSQAPQATQQATTESDNKLTKKDRKRLEKEQKKAREEQRKEEKRLERREAEERQKQFKEQEKRAAEERHHELKEQEKQVAAQQKKEEKYEHKQAQKEDKEEARELNRQIEHEEQTERASEKRVYIPRIPISHTATSGLLLAQREVSRAIYSQLPRSNVRVLLDNGNQIVLSGAAPSPSWKQRLFQLAVGAARGYSVVDQLASNLVGDAAGAATSAAIGGVSDLIHGSRSKDNQPDMSSASLPDSSQQANMNSQQAIPNSDYQRSVVLEPGSSACANLTSSSQVLLTGQAASQASADLIRQFARQLASPSAVLVDQLAVRTSGAASGAYAPQSPPNSSNTNPGPSANSPAATISPNSIVCASENNGELFLTGTVGSPNELGIVERSVQPLVGDGRLVDQLTIGNMSAATLSAPNTAVVSSSTSLPQSDIEQVLHSIPSLANVNVEVTSSAVRLSGAVDTTQDAQMASEIARQYAPGLAVQDAITVANTAPPHP